MRTGSSTTPVINSDIGSRGSLAGSVRCDAVAEGLFSAVALEMDPGNRIFTTLPFVPLPEMPSQE